MALHSICVFCGAKSGSRPVYSNVAHNVGKAIAEHGWRLVYGAGDAGLMGEVARAAIATGAPTLGVIPTHLLGQERGARDQSSLVITETMHERKKVMFMNSDAIVVLPGGAGSLDEFFEVLTWAQIGLHGKPIFLLDVEGYWRPLIALLDHVVTEGFAAPSLLTLVQTVPTSEALFTALRSTLDR